MDWSILIIDIEPFIECTDEIQRELDLCKSFCRGNYIKYLSLSDWINGSGQMDAYFCPSLKISRKEKLLASEKLVYYLSLKSGLDILKGGIVIHRNFSFDMVAYSSCNWAADIEKYLELGNINRICSGIYKPKAAEKTEKYGFSSLSDTEVEWFNCR